MTSGEKAVEVTCVVDVRKQLEMMGKAPLMYAVTREALFVHVLVLLSTVVGLHPTETAVFLGRVGKSKDLPDNVMDGKMMAKHLKVHDPWAQELSQAALMLLPAGSGVYEVRRATLANTGTSEEKITKARQALRKAMEELPHCRCGKLATMTGLDAAGDPWPQCGDHAKPGGMVGGEGPFERLYVKPMQEALAALEEA